MPLASSIDRPLLNPRRCGPSWRNSRRRHLRISDPTELDYLPTALILELEKRRRTPVVMIERPKGFDSTVVTNFFASRDRIARMVGAEPDGFNDAWVHALAHLTPPTVIGAGPVHDRVLQGNELDAAALPISRHYEKDAGRYIGSGILVCRDPDTGVRNLSYQRLQLKGANRFGASLHSRGHIWGAFATMCIARAKPRSCHRDRCASGDQPRGRREGGDGGR